MFDKARALFAPKPPEKQQHDVAWSGDNRLFASKDFPQYNPDAFIQRKGFGVYRKMMQDEQVKAVVKFRRDAITSRDWTFDLNDDDIGQDERGNRIALMNSIIEQMLRPKFTDALNGIMSATENGYSMTEKTFQQIEFDGKTWWGIKRLRLKPFDTFWFTPDEFGNLEKITQKVGQHEQEVDPEQFIHFVQNPSVDEYYGQSELREAYRGWFSKENVWKWRMIWLERHAGGFTWAQPVAGKELVPGTNEMTQIQNVLEGMRGGTSAILPAGIELKIEWPQQQVAFGDAIRDADFAIAKALLVPNLLGVTPDVGGGSLARSQTQLDAFLWTLDADAARLEDAINDAVFEPLSFVNFGGDPIGWPRFRFKELSDDQRMKTIDQWQNAVLHGAVTSSETDEKHIRDILGFPDKGENPLPTDPEGDGGNPLNNPLPDDEEGDDGGLDPGTPQTISGRGGQISVPAISGNMAVDVKSITRRGEEIAADGAEKVGAVMAEITRDALARIDQASDPADVVSFEVPGSIKQKLQRTLRAIMRHAWGVGQRHAEAEVMGGKPTFDRQRIDLVREEFFDLRSFIATGKLTDDYKSLVSAAILQGAKMGRTAEEVKIDIVQRLHAQGIMAGEAIDEIVGDVMWLPAGTASQTAARINTIIRTSTFEAINEARWTAFTDSSLAGHVEAFEYMAIEDDQTTDVCKPGVGMDGRIFAVDDPVWTGSPSWRPPNHFNCRSLLRPVTKGVEWQASSKPTIPPMGGFG